MTKIYRQTAELDWLILKVKPIQSPKMAISKMKTPDFCPDFKDKKLDNFPNFGQIISLKQG